MNAKRRAGLLKTIERMERAIAERMRIIRVSRQTVRRLRAELKGGA